MNHRGDGQAYQRGDVWWICYYHRGIRHRESVGTGKSELDARRLLRSRLADLDKGRTAAITAGKVTFEQLASGLLADYRINHRRSLEDIEINIRHLRAHFAGDLAADITRPLVRAFVDAMQRDGYANASINRYLAALTRMFKIALKDGILDSIPTVEKLAEDNVRQGTIVPGDLDRLLKCLPEYLRLPIQFAFRCGWRIGEIKTLQWRDVDFHAYEIRLRPEHSKNKQPRVIPLRGKLLELIEQAQQQRRLDCQYVFHNDGHRIGNFHDQWHAACRAAGLPGLRVHDLRRSAITNMIRAGADETSAMKISGHRTTSIFRRYDIRTTEDTARALDRLDAYLDQQPNQSKVIPITSTKV